MKVLYKDELENLAVMEVTKASYDDDLEVLELCGPEEDIAVRVSVKEAKKIVRELYQEDKSDVSEYEICEMEYDFEDDDDDEEYDDDEFDAMLDRILDESEKNNILRFM